MQEQAETLWRLVLAFLFAIAIGTTARHASAVRAGDYKITLRLIVLESPQYVGQCILAMALYRQFSLDPMTGIAVAYLLGWLGMRGVQAMVERVLSAIRKG